MLTHVSFYGGRMHSSYSRLAFTMKTQIQLYCLLPTWQVQTAVWRCILPLPPYILNEWLTSADCHETGSLRPIIYKTSYRVYSLWHHRYVTKRATWGWVGEKLSGWEILRMENWWNERMCGWEIERVKEVTDIGGGGGRCGWLDWVRERGGWVKNQADKRMSEMHQWPSAAIIKYGGKGRNSYKYRKRNSILRHVYP